MHEQLHLFKGITLDRIELNRFPRNPEKRSRKTLIFLCVLPFVADYLQRSWPQIPTQTLILLTNSYRGHYGPIGSIQTVFRRFKPAIEVFGNGP